MDGMQSLSSQGKMEYLLSELPKGVGREELARKLGYKNYKSMDIFARRNGYTWDKQRKTYLLPEERNSGRYAQGPPITKGKEGEIIDLLAKGGLDLKEVANRVGLQDHRKLATYMRAKGYLWDDEAQNYRQENGPATEPNEVRPLESSDMATPDCNQSGEIERYYPLLEFLLQHQEQLENILFASSNKSGGKGIPRLAVPGRFITKSVHMSCLLDQLTKDFSKEKNISQRELFEVALTEFFIRYGYNKEVNTLLQVKS